MQKKAKGKTTESAPVTRSEFVKTLIWFVISLAIAIPSAALLEENRMAHPGKAWPWDNNAPIYWYQITMWISEASLLISGLKLYYLNEKKNA